MIISTLRKGEDSGATAWGSRGRAGVRQGVKVRVQSQQGALGGPDSRGPWPHGVSSRNESPAPLPSPRLGGPPAGGLEHSGECEALVADGVGPRICGLLLLRGQVSGVHWDVRGRALQRRLIHLQAEGGHDRALTMGKDPSGQTQQSGHVAWSSVGPQQVCVIPRLQLCTSRANRNRSQPTAGSVRPQTWRGDSDHPQSPMGLTEPSLGQTTLVWTPNMH